MKKFFFSKFAMVLYFSIVGAVFSYGQKYEAENATYGGGAGFHNEDPGYSGTGFVWNFHYVGNYVEFSITNAVEGNQDVTLHYTTPLSGSLNLYVNGVLIRQEFIPSTGGFSNWQDYAVNVTLNAGDNTIKFQHDAENTGDFYYYIDYLTVAGSSAIANVSVSPETLNLTDIGSSQLTVTVLPEDAPNKTVTWSSSNTAVATVSETGLVMGKSAGNATITATTEDGHKTATCEVTVTASNATKYEAELATLSGLNVSTDQTGYSGTGFVNAFADGGNYLQFSVSAATNGIYDAVLNFATATGISLDLYVNGVNIKQIDLPNTGDWGNWTYHLDNITLNAGNNIIKYQKVSNDGHYLNVDYLALKEAVLTTTAYRWWGNDSSTSDSNKILAPELHDNDITTDVALAGGGEEVSPNKYEAAGLIFSYAQTITKVEFINGTYRGGNDDGSFEEVFKLQTSTDGTTWTDATEWTVSPAYEFLQTSISGATFTFTGSSTNILGVRVIGKVRTSESSGSWEARVREITAYGLISEVSEVMKESSVSIFPNPLSTGSLLIKLPESATQLSIFDITGKAVYQTPVTKSEYLIDQSVFKTEGVYIVNVMTLNNSMNKKVIVTK